MFLVYLKALQKELIILFLSIAIVVSIVVFSKQHWDDAVTKNKQAEQRLLQAKQKYRQAIDRKLVLKEYKKRHEALKKLNIVGDENRIDWINLIELIVEEEKIPYVSYKIDTQVQVNDKATAMKYPGLNIYKSVMTLDMRLLHEGDLYTVINNLKSKAKGLFDISSCNVKRNQILKTSIIESSQANNFTAMCKLNWYTFKPKDA